MYYILTKLNKLIIFGRNIAWNVGDEIRLGNLTSYLVSPVNQLLRHLSMYLGEVFSRIIMFLPIFFVALYFLFDGFRPSVFQIIYYLISLFLAMMINFMFFYFIGASTFYVGFVQGINILVFELISFLSGNIVPLNILPKWLEIITTNLPFKYISYSSINALTVSSNFSQAAGDVAIAFMWILILYAASSSIYRNGINKYEAYGS